METITLNEFFDRAARSMAKISKLIEDGKLHQAQYELGFMDGILACKACEAEQEEEGDQEDSPEQDLVDHLKKLAETLRCSA